MEVLLRPVVATDWPRVHEWSSSLDACRFQTWGPNTPEETEAFVLAAAATWDEPDGLRFAWACEHSEWGVVGLGELKVHDRTHQQGEISYAVHTAFWGRGIGEAIARRLLQIALAQENLHRVVGTCDPRNIASGRVLQKVGMTYEGRMRHTLLLRDGWRDSDVYSLLADDSAAATLT